MYVFRENLNKEGLNQFEDFIIIFNSAFLFLAKDLMLLRYLRNKQNSICDQRCIERVCVCVCVCVREREREEKEKTYRKKEKKGKKKERERKREREREREMPYPRRRK